MKNLNICIAGLGTVGANLIDMILKNSKYINTKSDLNLNIIAISAKNKLKKRIFDIDKFKWLDNPIDLAEINECDVIIELIGNEKGVSYDLVKKALLNKKHVITANKALIAKHGTELFEIAEKNNILLCYEAAVAGGIPIIKTLKNSLFLDKVKKITGILNGTTNYILTEMEKNNLSFEEVLVTAQSKGYAENDPTNDIEGIDSAHKLTILSSLCFGSSLSFDNNEFRGIKDIKIDDIKNANNLGYRIKLISETFIKNNKIFSVTEPKLCKKDSSLGKVDGVLNAVNIETDNLKKLFLEGEGAGGVPTASSIVSDLYEISSNSNMLSLGYKTKSLVDYKALNSMDNESSYYLRILTNDIPGVLSKITTLLNESNISIEKILQLPDSKSNEKSIPIIISTHKIKKLLLINAINKIEKLDFILEKIVSLPIDKS